MPLTEYLQGFRSSEMPEITGTRSGLLVICADSWRVWKDLEEFGCRSSVGRGKVRCDGDFMVVNKVGECFPGDIEHWYSNEGNLLRKFIAARRNEYRREFEGPRETHSCNKGAKWHWPFIGAGTSGLCAILAGLAMGYDNIVLCGMPLDNGPHNGEPHWRKTNFRAEVGDQVDPQTREFIGINRHWKGAIDRAFDGKVRSMSGRTKEWLGSP